MLLLQSCRQQAAEQPDSAFSVMHEDTALANSGLKYAEGFWLSDHQNYQILYLPSAQDTLRYLLLPRGHTPPSQASYDYVIPVPLRRVITQSTTHMGMLAFAGMEDIIVGIDEADYVYSNTIREKVVAGSIQEVGGGENLNMELVMALQPELLMVSGMPGLALERYQVLLQAGIPVLINSEWMESSPLAKAEWVKLIAALTRREAFVQQKFSHVEAQYDSLSALAASISEKPEVIVGSPFQGAWYVPGGRSYRSHLLQQAGALWPWAEDTSAVSLPVDFETMYAHGLQADCWLNPGQISSLYELQEKDTRFAAFKALRKGNVYNNNKRMNPMGTGNDYYESGVVNPHLILADLIRILHPELLPEHTLYYYQQLK